jgi:hypothetical protein
LRPPVGRGLDGHQIPGRSATARAALVRREPDRRHRARSSDRTTASLLCGKARGVRSGSPRRYFGLRHRRHDQRAAAAHALDKDMRIFLADAGMVNAPSRQPATPPIAHAAQHRCESPGADDGAGKPGGSAGDRVRIDGRHCRRAIFARVCHCDRSLHLANLFLLLTSALIPFPIAVLSAAIH